MALHVSCNIQCKVSLVCYLFSKVITPSFRSTYMDHGMPDPVSAPEKHIRKKMYKYRKQNIYSAANHGDAKGRLAHLNPYNVQATGQQVVVGEPYSI